MPKEKNIKKLVLQSQYVSEDLEEAKEKMAKYKDEFYKAFPEEYKKMIEKQNQRASQNVIHEDEDEEEENDSEKEEGPPKSETMRKLYRRISKITHPDKVESEFLTSYFKKASTAYSEDDVSELFTIATTLNIDITDIDSETIALELESSILNKSHEATNIKGSLAWSWAHADTEEEKQSIRDQIAQHIKDHF